MPSKKDLPDNAPAPATLSDLKLSAAPTRKLTPAQKRFNTLVAKVDKLGRQLVTMQAIADKLRPQYQQNMAALSEATDKARKDMVLFVCDKIQSKQLSPKPLRQAVEFVEAMLLSMDWESDPELRDIASAMQLEERQQALDEEQEQDLRGSLDALREQLERDLGVTFEGLDKAESADDMAMRMLEQARAHAEGAAGEAPPPPPKRRGKQTKAEKAQMDAKAALRTIYRQLASALHPDREPDAAEQQRKTALMSQVNAAYERNDLSALLRLQMQVEQIDADSVARMADEKLNAFSALLKEQAEDLDMQLAMGEMQLSEEFDTPISASMDEKGWMRRLHANEQRQRTTGQLMRNDLMYLHSNPGKLKTWLNERHAEMQRVQAMQSFGPDFDFF